MNNPSTRLRLIKKLWPKSLLGLAFLPLVQVSAQNIDWTETYSGSIDQTQLSLGTSWGFFSNLYGWDRDVTLWQEFTAGQTGDLAGIALYMIDSAPSGNFDLNIYSGTGVEGSLLQSTNISWVTDYNTVHPLDEIWYTFQLDSTIGLTSGLTYTFSIENLSSDSIIKTAVSSTGGSDPYPDGVYMHQGYQMPSTYTQGGTAEDIAFQTVMVPEPSTYALFIGILCFGWVAIRRLK